MNTATRAEASWAKVAYGIDVSGSDISFVRAERFRGGVRCKTLPFDSTELEKATKQGAAVAASLPVGSSVATWVITPFASTSKACRVFPTLLDIQLPFALENCVYTLTEPVRLAVGEALVPARETADEVATVRTASLAIAARADDVEQRIKELSECEIDPHVLDHEGVALWTQALREIPPESTSGSIRVVTMLRGDASVIVIGQGARYWSAHRFRTSAPLQFDRYIRAQVQQHSLDPDAISVDWVLAGSVDKEAAWRDGALASWPGSSRNVEDPESFLARALATRALLPGPLRGNLRQGDLVHHEAESRTYGVWRRVAAIWIIAGLILCAVPGVWSYLYQQRRSEMEQKFTERLRQLLGYPEKARGANALLIAERELERRTEERQPFADAMKPSLLTDLQQVVAEIGNDDIHIGYLMLERGTLKIEGTLATRSAGVVLKNALTDCGYELELTLREGDAPIAFSAVAGKGAPDA